ncbi:MAG: hypothetical protein LQ349_002205 [Xanthoria aureola]|nr:MAG: hypothetical protein LQ349_002205 [Xanthoria aureola]
MADEQTSFRRQPIPALARDNKDDWFQTMQVFLESKDLWHVIDLHASPVLTPASTESSAPTPLPDSSFPNKKPDAEARFTLLLCVDADNREIIGELASAGAMWRTLRAKYTDNLQVTNRSLHVNHEEKSIPNSPPISPDEYRTTVDTLDAQKDVDIDFAINTLREKEATLQIEESANWAKNKPGRPPIRQKNSKPALREGKSRLYRKESLSDDEVPMCFLGNASGHAARKCPEARKFQRWLRAESKSKLQDKNTRSKDKFKDKGKGKSSKKSGHRAYTAES